MTLGSETDAARLALAGLLADYAAAVDARDAGAVGEALGAASVTFKGTGPMSPEAARAFYADALASGSATAVTHLPGTPSVRSGAAPGEIEFSAPYLRCTTAPEGVTAVHAGRYRGTASLGAAPLRLHTFVVSDT